MNWYYLKSGNPVATQAAITICLVVSGYLAVVPFQKDDQFIDGILLVDTTHSIAIQDDINDWIVSEGDAIQTGQIIGYTLSKQHRQALETMVDIGLMDQAFAIGRIHELLDAGTLGDGPARSWIGRHVIQSTGQSGNHTPPGEPNKLPELNRSLTEVEEELGFLRMRRLNQPGSGHAEEDLTVMNALEKEQMKLRRQINAEILRSERSVRQVGKQSRWTLNAPLDSLLHIAKSELQQAAVAASASGYLSKYSQDMGRDQFQIVSIGSDIVSLELESGVALEISENQVIRMILPGDGVTDSNHVTSGRIVGVQQVNDKILVRLAMTDQDDIAVLSTTTALRILSDVQEQMTIFGLLTCREL